MKRPPFLKKDLDEAKQLIQKERIGPVLFSEGTYQIQVKDKTGRAGCWPFLQLDDAGDVLDCFCTCADAEKRKACPHLAAALEMIFHGHSQPLHVRFRGSLWNQLCQIASRRHGYEPDQLKKEGKGWQALAATGKILCQLVPHTEQGSKRLKEILLERKNETEETSLKFSKLSAEELALWRSGAPSHQLSYELSFWSDLAKWWMLLQDAGEEYQISFDGDPLALPKGIKVRFAEVSFQFYIAESNWPILIHPLSTVNSPLKVYPFAQKEIRGMVYEPKKKQFHLQFTSLVAPDEGSIPEGAENKQIPVGEWYFAPGRGFFPAELDPLLQQEVISEEQIGTLLQKHSLLVQQYVEIHTEPLKAHYYLSFDKRKQLKIACYVFEPKDLQQPLSASFGHWVYIQDKGFYRLDQLIFEGTEKTVAPGQLSDFINRHRNWLNQFDGFQIHLSSIESHLNYTVTPEGLHFEAQHELAGDAEDYLDFGEWLYVRGRGFYAKSSRLNGEQLRHGLMIPKEEISRFIKGHKEELEQIPRFFASHSPVERSGVEITFGPDLRIHVRPRYFALPSYQKTLLEVFGDYTYIASEGFFPIPDDKRLPEGFTTHKIITAADEPYFIATQLDILLPCALFVDPRLTKPKELFLRIDSLKRDDRSKQTSWIVGLSYESELGKVPLHQIWRASQQNHRYYFSKAGLLFLKQPRFNWLKGILRKRWIQKGATLRLTTMEWIRLSVYDDPREPTDNSQASRQVRKLMEDFRCFFVPQPIDLHGFKSSLRPYQHLGVRWLWFLHYHGLSGMLCDEMGLGKTHQAMGLIAAIDNAAYRRGQRRPQVLVLCPTSVLYHWEALLHKFLPSIPVTVFHGAGRKLELIPTGGILLTSYGVLRSEKELFAQIPFDLVVYDELQIAKNPSSQTHKALKEIIARMRVGLTGTPIENRLLELKALFDLVIPRYMPTETYFRELFINPIEKHQDPEKRLLLSRLIKPFILRRKKSEVLQELPEKIEEIAYCDLSKEQHALYRKTFLAQEQALIRQLENPNEPVPYLHIFSVLSTLKQICDHPCLITPATDSPFHHASGKWDLFVELLHEARDSGQKVVVFSQYLEMLNIIETYLTSLNIGYAGIRGSTRDRKEQLERFRDDPTCEVFVASLQAAGVGIDLVSASVVIHYDRWWNPARENQATDRVHRIGQNRGVQVFKLVTKGTIEEHIDRLIQKKVTLTEGVLGFDDQLQLKSFNRAELIELLRHIADDLHSSD